MAYEVVIEPMGQTLLVSKGESVLDAAIAAGINLPYGCRNALCGACKARLVTGEISYAGKKPVALSQKDRENGMVLLCHARPRSNLRVDIASTSLITKKIPVRVEQMDLLSEDVMRLYLSVSTVNQLEFHAGQYIDILLPDGRRRSFSLANPPQEKKQIELHIRHVDGGDYTHTIFHDTAVGDVLSIEGPYGDFYLREESTRPIIFIAGGTGFAPIKGVVEYANNRGIELPMSLYWGARNQAGLYQHVLASAWAKADHFSYHPVLSNIDEQDLWPGRRGYVHEAILADYDDLGAYDVYACGPPVMVTAAHEACLSLGLPKDRFFSDSFEFANDKKVKKTS